MTKKNCDFCKRKTDLLLWIGYFNEMKERVFAKNPTYSLCHIHYTKQMNKYSKQKSVEEHTFKIQVIRNTPKVKERLKRSHNRQAFKPF